MDNLARSSPPPLVDAVTNARGTEPRADESSALTTARQHTGRSKQFDPIGRTDGGECGFLIRGWPPGHRHCDRLDDRAVEVQEALQRRDTSQYEPTCVL